jgi:hypothetical protein
VEKKAKRRLIDSQFNNQHPEKGAHNVKSWFVQINYRQKADVRNSGRGPGTMFDVFYFDFHIFNGRGLRQ